MPNDPLQSPSQFTNIESKRSKKRIILIVVGAILGMLLIAGGTVALLTLLHKDSKPSSSTPTAITLPEVKNGLAKALAANETLSAQIYQPNDPSTVVRTVAAKSWVPLDRGSSALTVSASSSTTETNKAEYDTTTAYLKSVGFNEIQAHTPFASHYTSDATSVQYFAAEKVVCTLHNLIEEKKYTLQADCASVDSFAKLSESVKPLVAVYDNKSGKDTVFTTASIEESGTKEYHTALSEIYALHEPNTTAATAFFYQIPDHSWHFLASAEDRNTIPCATFSGDDAINAFVGFPCWDATANKSAFVQKPAPVFKIVPGSQG